MDQFGRRRFLAAGGVLSSTPVVARARTTKKLPVLEWLSPSRRPSSKEMANFPMAKRLAQLVSGPQSILLQADGVIE